VLFDDAEEAIPWSLHGAQLEALSSAEKKKPTTVS